MPCLSEFGITKLHGWVVQQAQELELAEVVEGLRQLS